MIEDEVTDKERKIGFKRRDYLSPYQHRHARLKLPKRLVKLQEVVTYSIQELSHLITFTKYTITYIYEIYVTSNESFFEVLTHLLTYSLTYLLTLLHILPLYIL